MWLRRKERHFRSIKNIPIQVARKSYLLWKKFTMLLLIEMLKVIILIMSLSSSVFLLQVRLKLTRTGVLLVNLDAQLMEGWLEMTVVDGSKAYVWENWICNPHSKRSFGA